MRRRKKPSLLAGAARGLAAGIVATAAITVSQEVVSRFRGRSQFREQAKTPRTWADAPAPAQVAKRVSEGVFSYRVTKKQAPVVASVVHWTYGCALGCLFGVMQAKAKPPAVLHGLAFGTVVWAWAYVLLPPLKIYEPIWRYPAGTLAVDLSQHLVFGLTLAGAYEGLERR